MQEHTKRKIAALEQELRGESDMYRRLNLVLQLEAEKINGRYEDAAERAEELATKPVKCDFEAERAARRSVGRIQFYGMSL